MASQRSETNPRTVDPNLKEKRLAQAKKQQEDWWRKYAEKECDCKPKIHEGTNCLTIICGKLPEDVYVTSLHVPVTYKYEKTSQKLIYKFVYETDNATDVTCGTCKPSVYKPSMDEVVYLCCEDFPEELLFQSCTDKTVAWKYVKVPNIPALKTPTRSRAPATSKDLWGSTDSLDEQNLFFCEERLRKKSCPSEENRQPKPSKVARRLF